MHATCPLILLDLASIAERCLPKYKIFIDIAKGQITMFYTTSCSYISSERKVISRRFAGYWFLLQVCGTLVQIWMLQSTDYQHGQGWHFCWRMFLLIKLIKFQCSELLENVWDVVPDLLS
jgi:hypothetical protein